MTLSPERLEEFFSRIEYEPNTGCWLWSRGGDSWGYGLFRVGPQQRKAVRVLWEIERGPIPTGLCLCHRCDTPACVNPDHIFLGTHADNCADKVAKGRARGGRLPPERHHSTKLSWDKVREIRRLRAAGITHTQIARQYGVSQTTVSKIARGEKWREEKNP